MKNGPDFKSLGHQLMSQVGELLARWLPGGRIVGQEYVCGNLRGGLGDSLKVNVKTGRWADFATDAKGGDLISLYAAIEGMSQGEAAKKLMSSTKITRSSALEPQVEPPTVKVEKPPKDASKPDMIHPQHGRPSSSWTYLDKDGDLLFYIARYDVKGGKQLVPWSWATEDKRWIMKGWQAPRPLYGLHDLAQRPDAPVVIVEGEKAAEAAKKLMGAAYVVVTWTNGANGIGKSDWTPLHYRKSILIWPDSDEPGMAAAKLIAMTISGKCKDVKVIDPAGQPKGWDAADAVAEGWDWQSLLAWAKPRAKKFGTREMPASPIEATAVAVAQGGKGETPVVAAAQVQVNISPDGDPGYVSMSLAAMWEHLGITCTEKGVPFCNFDNILRVLENHKIFENKVWVDDFHGKIFTTWRSKEAVEWSDSDTIRLMGMIQRELALRRIGKDAVYDAVCDYANQHRRNEPKDWMESLKWDGTTRIERFLEVCMGAVPGVYTQAVSRNFWIGMVARVLDPGCKMDTMVILEGKQGIYKSTALATIGGKWYAETSESVMSKDFFLNLKGKLILEIADLDGFRKAEVTRIKQVLSCRSDRYRTPYGRTAQDHPRMSVLAGTTNEHNYLLDSTGGRRFWPLVCGKISLIAIKDFRDQFFAEAVAMHKEKKTWWEMPVDETLDEQEKRRQADELEPHIYEFIKIRDEVTVLEVAMECLHLEIGKVDRQYQMRIASMLRLFGWEKLTVRSGDKVSRVWRNPKTKESET